MKREKPLDECLLNFLAAAIIVGIAVIAGIVYWAVSIAKLFGG